MPITNNNYTAPAWNNNNPPAIDASELSAISTTLESNQRKIGDTLLTSRTDLGSNYLLCNGEELNSITYPELSAVLPAPSIYDDYRDWNNAMWKIPNGYSLYTGSDPFTKRNFSGMLYASGYYVYFYSTTAAEVSSSSQRYIICMMYSSSLTGPWNVRLIASESTSNTILSAAEYSGNVYLHYRQNDGNNAIYKIQPPFATSSFVTYTSGTGRSPNGMTIIDGVMYIAQSDGEYFQIRYKNALDPTGSFLVGAGITDRGFSSPTKPIKVGNKYYVGVTAGDRVWIFSGTSLMSGTLTQLSQVTYYSGLVDTAIAGSSKYIYVTSYNSGYSGIRYFSRIPIAGGNAENLIAGISFNGNPSNFVENSKYAITSFVVSGVNSPIVLSIVDKTTDSVIFRALDRYYSYVSNSMLNENTFILFDYGCNFFVRKFNAKYLPVVDGAGQNVMIRAK